MDLSFLGNFCFFINKSRKLEKSCGFYHCVCQSLDKGGESELRFLSKMHIHTYKTQTHDLVLNGQKRIPKYR